MQQQGKASNGGKEGVRFSSSTSLCSSLSLSPLCTLSSTLRRPRQDARSLNNSIHPTALPLRLFDVFLASHQLLPSKFVSSSPVRLSARIDPRHSYSSLSLPPVLIYVLSPLHRFFLLSSLSSSTQSYRYASRTMYYLPFTPLTRSLHPQSSRSPFFSSSFISSEQNFPGGASRALFVHLGASH